MSQKLTELLISIQHQPNFPTIDSFLNFAREVLVSADSKHARDLSGFGNCLS